MYTVKQHDICIFILIFSDVTRSVLQTDLESVICSFVSLSHQQGADNSAFTTEPNFTRASNLTLTLKITPK